MRKSIQESLQQNGEKWQKGRVRKDSPREGKVEPVLICTVLQADPIAEECTDTAKTKSMGTTQVNCTCTVSALHLAMSSNYQRESFPGQEAPNVDQQKYKRKPQQPVLTLQQCPTARLRWISATGSSWLDQAAGPGTPHRQHPQPGPCPQGPSCSSDCRTQVPTETVLVGK